MRLNTHFFVISYQMTCSHCAPDSNVHSYEIFKTMIHFPNHERCIPASVSHFLPKRC